MNESNTTVNYGPAIVKIALAIELGDLEKARAAADSMPERIKKKKIKLANI